MVKVRKEIVSHVYLRRFSTVLFKVLVRGGALSPRAVA